MPRKQNQSREVKAHSAKKRVRVPIGSGNKLHVSPELMEEGYHYYWAVGIAPVKYICLRPQDMRK